jgi:hypothetical protein
MHIFLKDAVPMVIRAGPTLVSERSTKIRARVLG